MVVMITDTESKVQVCRTCGFEKPASEFWIGNRLRSICHPCFLAELKTYHYKHWDEYYQKHSDARRQRSREDYKIQRVKNLETYGTTCTPSRLQEIREHTEKIRTTNMALYGHRKSPIELEKGRQHFLELRTRALECYGGRCECCGEARYDMLTFDHINKTYYKDKVRGVALTYDVIRKYEELGYPNNIYRILCWNCNMSRGFYKYCPHEHNHNGMHDYQGKTNKLEMIEAYGGKCSLCGEAQWEFLTIDHINGGGTKHRKEIGSLYHLLKKQGWPKDGYRLLCSNCNCSLKRNKWSQKGVEA